MKSLRFLCVLSSVLVAVPAFADWHKKTTKTTTVTTTRSADVPLSPVVDDDRRTTTTSYSSSSRTLTADEKLAQQIFKDFDRDNLHDFNYDQLNITKDSGKVYLQGRVHTREQKDRLFRSAQNSVGVDTMVMNRLEIQSI